MPRRRIHNSAVAAGNPAFFAVKDETTKPAMLFLGPVRGQEVEGIVGLVNLIHMAETGRDHRGREWAELKRRLDLSALHHVSGAMAITFECSHGTVSDDARPVTHEQILDIQLLLYDEILRYALENPRTWTRP